MNYSDILINIKNHLVANMLTYQTESWMEPCSTHILLRSRRNDEEYSHFDILIVLHLSRSNTLTSIYNKANYF